MGKKFHKLLSYVNYYICGAYGDLYHMDEIYSTNISVMQGLLDLEKFVSPAKILQLYGSCVLFLSLIIILMEPLKLLLCCTNF